MNYMAVDTSVMKKKEEYIFFNNFFNSLKHFRCSQMNFIVIDKLIGNARTVEVYVKVYR